jgi:hypothetical protein
MYFKGHEVRRGYTDFEKKDTLSQMPVSKIDDGNNFFSNI